MSGTSMAMLPAVLSNSGKTPASGVVERRSNRLARGLHRLGVRPGGHVTLFLADPDGIDGVVALCAARMLRLDTSVVAVPEDDALGVEAARRVAIGSPDAVLACERGVLLLRRAGAGGLVIGDGPGVYWWKAIEARERADDLASGDLT